MKTKHECNFHPPPLRISMKLGAHVDQVNVSKNAKF